MTSLNSLLQKIKKKFPTKDAIVNVDNNTKLTYNELLDQIEIYTYLLKESNINKNDNVGICLQNSIFQIAIFFSLINIGANPVLIDNQYTSYEITECLASTNTKKIITENNIKKEKIINDLKSKNINIILKNDIQNSLKHTANINQKSIFISNIKKTESKIVLFTYRGLGKILPVIHTETTIYNSVLKNNYLTEIDSTLHIILLLPFSHIFALTANILSPLSVGGTLHISNNLQPGKILNILTNFNINFIILVPTLLKVFLYSLKKKKYNISVLNKGIIGGDVFSQDLYDEWKKYTGCNILQGFGLTETCPVFCNQWNNNKPDSFGKTMLNVEAKITDSNGKKLNNLKEGMLWIKSNSTMIEYYNNNELTNSCFNDRWFYTGDIAYKDNDDFYYFVHRDKKIAKIGGTTVDIIEVKNHILKHPDIQSAEIEIENDNLWNDRIVCYIKSSVKMDKSEIITFLQEYLSNTKIPRKFIFN